MLQHRLGRKFSFLSTNDGLNLDTAHGATSSVIAVCSRDDSIRSTARSIETPEDFSTWRHHQPA
jgi:hypothetical protein